MNKITISVFWRSMANYADAPRKLLNWKPLVETLQQSLRTLKVKSKENSGETCSDKKRFKISLESYLCLKRRDNRDNDLFLRISLSLGEYSV